MAEVAGGLAVEPPRPGRPARLIAARPWLVLVLVALLSALAVEAVYDPSRGGLQVRIDPALDALIMPGIPARQAQDEIERRFAAREQVVVVLRHADVYTPAFLERLDALSRTLGELPGVTRVHSLTTVPLPTVSGDDLSVDRLGSADGIDTGRLDALRNTVRNNPLVHGQLVAADGRAAAIVVELDDASDRERAALGLPGSIIAAADAHAEALDGVHVTGAPVLRHATGAAVLDQLRWIVPLITAVVCAFLALAFRTLRGVLLPLATIALALLWTLAAFAVLNRPLNLVTSLVPPLVVTMSLAYCAHVLSEFEALLRAAPEAPRAQLIRDLVRMMTAPVALTAFTTSVGVAALGISPLPAVREFALLSVVGVVCAALLALFFVPAALAFVAPRPEPRPPGGRDLFDRLAARLGDFDIRHRRAILATAVAVLLLSLLSAGNVRVDDHFVGVFEPDARVRIDYEAANRAIGGVAPLTLLIDGHDAGALTEPEALQALARLQDWLITQPEVGAVSGLVDHVRLLARTLGSDPAGALPDDQARTEQLLFFGGGSALRQILSADRSATVLQLRLTVDSTHEVEALIERLRARLTALPASIDVRIGGDAALAAESVGRVTEGQLQSIALALALIYLCLALQFASFKVGLLATLPTLLQTAIYFGALGLFGVTLNATTSLVECLVLGLAIDDTIHYLARFNDAARRKASEQQGAVAALGAVLRPVTLTKAILGIGFLVLITGDLHNQVVFGWLAAGTLFVAWLVDVFVTPAFMSRVRIVTIWDALRVDLGTDVQRTMPLLAGLSPRQARIFALMANLQTVPAGVRLMSEGESCGDGRPGDPAGDIYVVVDGRLEVWLERDGRRQVLNVLERGAVVGEIGYFGQKRVANVDTLSRARLLRFDDADQERICRQYPGIAARVFLNLNRLQAERRATQMHATG